MSDVRLFPGVIEPESNASNPMVEDVLAGAIELEKVIVVGVTRDNKFYVSASHPDIYENVYLIAKAQQALLNLK